MDSAKLLIADEFIQNRLPDAFSLLVVKNGYLKKTEIGNGMETKFQNSQSSY